MNISKGLKRLTLVLSLLAGPIVFLYLVLTEGPPDDTFELFVSFPLLGVIGFVVVWAIYALVAFVVNGFLDVKVEQKTNRDTMNLRRGFRRITFVLAIVTGILGAFLGVVVSIKIDGEERAGDYGKYHSKSFIVVNVIGGNSIDITMPDIEPTALDKLIKGGDSIDITIPDSKLNHTRVQLWGINTPQIIMEQANKFIKELTLGKPIIVYLDEGNRTRDKYGRLLAYVKLGDGRFLNEVLLTEGFAYADLRLDHSLHHRYKQLETIAQEQKRRLWGIEPKPDRHKHSFDSSIEPFVIKVILRGLCSAAIGYFGTWLVLWWGGLAVYKLTRWLVLGFYDSKGQDIRGKGKEIEG